MNRHCNRMVEGDDPADYAIRLPGREVEPVRAAGNRAALKLIPQTREVAQPFDAGGTSPFMPVIELPESATSSVSRSSARASSASASLTRYSARWATDSSAQAT